MAQFGVDVFTGTDTTELTVYSANWAKQTGNTGNVSISNANRAHGVTVSGNGSYIWQGGSPASADYTVAADVVCIGTVTGVTAGVQGRAVAAANTAYVARHLAGTGWQLQKVVAGVTTNLGTAGVATLTVNQVYRLTLSMVGSTITLNVDGTDLVSVTDTAITAAGAAGLRCFGQSGNANGEHLDNWTADDVGGGTTYSDSVSESGTASDSSSAAASFAAGLAESGSAADTVSAVVIYAASVAESGNASDSDSAIATFRPSVAESGVAADIPSAVMTTSASVSESGNASDASSTGGAASSASVAESGNAVDTITAAVVFQGSISEGTASLQDTLAASAIWSAFVGELLAAADQVATIGDTSTVAREGDIGKASRGRTTTITRSGITAIKRAKSSFPQ